VIDVAAGLSCAGIGALGGLLVPNLIERIPEPEDRVVEPSRDEGVSTALDQPGLAHTVKELYADVAALPGLRWWAALASGAAAFVVGASLGWVWDLLYLLVLCPVGVALAVIDWRTHLLPTRVIAPTYGVVILLLVVAALVAGDPRALLNAFVGWLLYGLLFFVLWFFSRGAMGYGDVRLSGVLGIALGTLGFETFFVGMVSGALLGAVASVATWITKGRGQEFAYGPYMLLGVLVGVTLGPEYARHLNGG
jgi:leader peptidase (prepilin peptidase)/N-methyltransferase